MVNLLIQQLMRMPIVEPPSVYTYKVCAVVANHAIHHLMIIDRFRAAHRVFQYPDHPSPGAIRPPSSCDPL
jgi:hypothetical protein